MKQWRTGNRIWIYILKQYRQGGKGGKGVWKICEKWSKERRATKQNKIDQNTEIEEGKPNLTIQVMDKYIYDNLMNTSSETPGYEYDVQ